MNKERAPWIFREPEERQTSEESVPWIFRGGILANLIRKYKPVAIIAYVSASSAFLFLLLSFLTDFAIFLWLRNVAIIVVFAITLAGIITNVTDYLRERKAHEQERQASR